MQLIHKRVNLCTLTHLIGIQIQQYERYIRGQLDVARIANGLVKPLEDRLEGDFITAIQSRAKCGAVAKSCEEGKSVLLRGILAAVSEFSRKRNP